MRKFGKRLGIVLLVMAALVAGLVLLSPVWIPPVGSTVAKRYGVEWEDAGAAGWSTFSFTNLRISGEAFEVTIDRATIPQPIPWLAGRFGLAGRLTAEAGQVVVQVWESPEPGPPEPPGSVGIEILETVRAGLVKALPWLPKCAVGGLSVFNPEGSPYVVLENMVLYGRTISADWPAQYNIPPLQLRAFLADDSIRLDAQPQDAQNLLQLTLRLDPARQQPSASATLLSKGIPLEAEAQFQQGEWIPAKLNLKAADWPVPRQWLAKVALRPDNNRADLEASWDGQRYQTRLRLVSEDLLPALAIGQLVSEISFSGDFEQIDIAELNINSLWLVASLSKPIRYSIRDKHFAGDASFRLQANLAGQSWLPARGQVEAIAQIQTDNFEQPELEFSLSAKDLVIQEFPVRKLDASGTLAYPQLELTSLSITLDPESSLTASGSYSLQDQTIAAAGTFQVDPEWIRGYTSTPRLQGAVQGDFSVEGPVATPHHTGQIQPVGLSMNGLHPLELTARWEGAGLNGISLDLLLNSDQGSQADVDLQVLWKQESKELIFEVDDLILLDPQDHLLALDESFSIELGFEKAGLLRRITPIHLSGDGTLVEGTFDADLPLLSASGSGIDLRLLESWLDASIPPILLDQFSATVTRLRPTLAGAFQIRLQGADPRYQELNLSLAGNLSDLGFRFDSLDGNIGTIPFIHGDLALPVQLNLLEPGKPLLSPIPGQSLHGSLTANISKDLARRFPEFDFIEEIPQIKIDIQAEGTPEEPAASIKATLSHLEILHLFDERLGGYPLQEIQLSAHLSRNSVELRSFKTVISEARLSAEGSVPTQSILALLQNKKKNFGEFLETATLSLSCQNMMARAFSSLLPDFMRPSGRLDGSLIIRPGTDIQGSLKLQDFSLRPTLYSQTVDGINLLLDVDGTRLTLSEAGASIGRSQASLTGFIDLANLDLPVYALKLQGTRIPLIRTPDLMVFGDVNLLLDGQDPEKPTRLSGEIALRDSLLLLEIDPLAAQTTGKNLARPPFFSIDKAPFEDWVLDIDISGDDCLRFKSPYARAVLSAQMDLGGTLGAPIWVGNIYSSDGIIDFPGIRTTLSRSDIFVTRERQDILQLDINALGQVSSYVISVTVSGTTDDPHVTFASTPDLSNSEILQFLATGSPNRSGVGSVGLYLGKGLISPGSDTLWDRVSVEVGRDVSEANKDTVDLYYDLTDKLRLHGEYDKYDAQNLNLEWEVFKR